MSDAADDSDAKIHNLVVLGIEKAERDAVKTRLLPIILELDGNRWGVCHWCESDIAPGHLFCSKDPNDPGMSCSESLEHEHKRRRDQGL